MIHTKFEAPDPSNSGEEEILVYSFFEPEDSTPLGHFEPQCHHLNKLDRILLGNAIYQISSP